MVFGDASYWAAVFNPRDQWHEHALRASAALADPRIVTTEEVLNETLSLLTSRGLRHQAAQVVRTIIGDPDVTVIPQSHESFEAGLALFESRLDRAYSLTDCTSMCAMRQLGLFEALTHDHHFEQEGFVALLRQS